MAKLLSEMSKEELEILCREQNADIAVLSNSKRVVLDKNKKLAEMYVKERACVQQLNIDLMDAADTILRLQAENAKLIMICRNNGIDI